MVHLWAEGDSPGEGFAWKGMCRPLAFERQVCYIWFYTVALKLSPRAPTFATLQLAYRYRYTYRVPTRYRLPYGLVFGARD